MGQQYVATVHQYVAMEQQFVAMEQQYVAITVGNNVAFLQSSTYFLQNVEPYVQPYLIFENICAMNFRYKSCPPISSTIIQQFFNSFQYCKLLKKCCKIWPTQK